MAEGDTIHRIALRIEAVLGDREIERASAPNPRSPLHKRTDELTGCTLERVEARGKHLLMSFSSGLAIHSHLGINGSFRVGPREGAGRGMPWLELASGEGVAVQRGGKLLRLISESRLRNDPGLAQLGPDPLAADFDLDDAARRLRGMGAGFDVGDALLDQRVVAGIGNAIRAEGCFRARISPWRPVSELSERDAVRLIHENQQVMRATLEAGSRPRSIYARANRPCPRCGTRIRALGQGDANRRSYWCPTCQE
jgi:endonuclease-8